LHHQTGPAVVFGTGVELFAWHGSWIPEAAIRNPESLTRPAIQAENDPKVREALIQIYGAERYERERPPEPARKLRNPLEILMPFGLDPKIAALRKYGSLPYYGRYRAGEHREVWQELGAIGPNVREDALAADARAVAFATMTRVRENLVTLIERLRELGYEFEVESGAAEKVIPFGEARAKLMFDMQADPPAPLKPPRVAPSQMKRLRKDAGELPILLARLVRSSWLGGPAGQACGDVAVRTTGRLPVLQDSPRLG
jgi:hypothetical protein